MSEIISEGQRQEWRKMYHSKRYLSFLSINDLEKRLDQILVNLLNFSKDGIPLLDDTKQMDGFFERLIHLEEEMTLRNISIDLDSKIKKYSEKYQNIVKAMSVGFKAGALAGVDLFLEFYHNNKEELKDVTAAPEDI